VLHLDKFRVVTKAIYTAVTAFITCLAVGVPYRKVFHTPVDDASAGLARRL